VAVYVDDARIRWRGRYWSHLVADTADELHAAAASLGIPREFAQTKGRTLHYDLTDEFRDIAIDRGIAEAIPWRELVQRRAQLGR